MIALVALALAQIVGRASVYSADDPGGYGGGGYVGCPAAAHRLVPECCEGRTGRTGRWQGKCRLECVRSSLLARGLHVVAMRPQDARCGGRVRICRTDGGACVAAVKLDTGPWGQVRDGHRWRFGTRLAPGYHWRAVADLAPATWRALGGTGHLRVRIDRPRARGDPARKPAAVSRARAAGARLLGHPAPPGTTVEPGATERHQGLPGFESPRSDRRMKR